MNLALLSEFQREAITTLRYGFPTLFADAARKHGIDPDAGEDFSLARAKASKLISECVTDDKPRRLKDSPWPWAYWTKQTVCAQALFESRGNVEAALDALRPSIGKGVKATTFTKNVKGIGRVPLPENEQIERLRAQIITMRDDVSKALKAEGIEEGGEQQQRDDKDERKQEKKREPHPLLVFIRNARKFCEERQADGKPLDEIGLRPAEYGAKMLKAGIPITAIKHALTMHWPPEARRAVGVKDYDVTTFRPDDRKDGMHAALPYVLALVGQRIPTALVGPKGTGKTTLARQVSEILGVPFGMVSMTSATSPSAFNGRPRIASDGTDALIAAMIANGREADALKLALRAKQEGDVVTSQFAHIYANGGVFLFDEMDAADENLLLLVNAALANGQFSNSATGEIVKQSPDFIPMAGMNTLGLGAGRDYNSRNKLDAATLDRWNAGRVQIRLDERVEEAVFYGNLA